MLNLEIKIKVKKSCFAKTFDFIASKLDYNEYADEYLFGYYFHPKK